MDQNRIQPRLGVFVTNTIHEVGIGDIKSTSDANYFKNELARTTYLESFWTRAWAMYLHEFTNPVKLNPHESIIGG